MKNASCHDDKMEAYCKAVRALEDKFYDIELNHVPRWYNEEADKPPVDLDPNPSSREEPSKAPSSPTGAEPMDEDPSNEAYVLALLEGYGADETEAMETKPVPARETGGTNTSPGWTEGSYPRTDPRPDASPGWPSHSPSSTASCTSAPRQASCSDAFPSLRGASSFETST
jgi:hypothetical protein